MQLTTFALVVCLVATSAFALADDRPEHYSGEKVETLEGALENLREYSGRLASIVQGDDFGADRLQSVHEITYSLENALERIEKELEQLAETLESVHIASEHGDTDTVSRDTAVFIEKTRVLLQRAPGNS